MKKCIKGTFGLCFLFTILAVEILAQQNEKSKATKGTELSELISTITNVINVVEKHNIVYDRQYVSTNALLYLIRLFDSKAQILNQEEAKKLKEYQDGTYYGAGIKIRIKNGMPLVLEVLTNSPAARAGIKGEAVIVAIDGKAATNLPLNDIEMLLKDNAPRDLSLDIKPNLRGSETNSIRIKLEAMQIAPAMIEEWNHDINYVKINNLFPGSGATIASSIKKWRDSTNSCTGIIIDMRGTDGADIGSVVELASLFSSKEKILFTIRSADGTEQAKYQHKEEKPLNIPIIVLIDKKTSGTAELLAAILAETKGVMLAGENTSGDNKVRSFIPFQKDKSLYIATGEFVLSKEGVFYAGCGVKPHITIKGGSSSTKDVAVSSTTTTKAAAPEMTDVFGNIAPEEKLDSALLERLQFDSTLRRAVDILLGLKALNITMRSN
jgi:carboxyl-terminal processing protease